MNCQQLKSAIPEIARSGRVMQPEEMRHLQTCEKCAERLKAEQQLSAALQLVKLEPVNASVRVQQNLLAEMRKRNDAKPDRIWMWRISRIAAVLMLAALTGAWIIHHQKSAVSVTSTEPDAQPETTEVTTDFIPLTHGELAGGSVQMIRVKLPRSALMQFGLPVNMDHPDQMIDADVIVGEEGLPHAIRFIERTNFINMNQEEK